MCQHVEDLFGGAEGIVRTARQQFHIDVVLNIHDLSGLELPSLEVARGYISWQTKPNHSIS